MRHDHPKDVESMLTSRAQIPQRDVGEDRKSDADSLARGRKHALANG